MEKTSVSVFIGVSGVDASMLERRTIRLVDRRLARIAAVGRNLRAHERAAEERAEDAGRGRARGRAGRARGRGGRARARGRGRGRGDNGRPPAVGGALQMI
jgi:hypothetical protein